MAETWNLVCLLETEEAPVIDDDSTHVCMSFYVRKRGHFSVSQSRLSKNAKSGRRKRRERTRSRTERELKPPMRAIETSDYVGIHFSLSRPRRQSSHTAILLKKLSESPSRARAKFAPGVRLFLRTEKGKKRKNRERKTHETTKALRNPHLSRCSRFGRR